MNSDETEVGQEAMSFVSVTAEAELQQADLTGGKDWHFVETAAKAGEHKQERQLAVLKHVYPVVQEEAAR